MEGCAYNMKSKLHRMQYLFAVLIILAMLVGCTPAQNTTPTTEPSATYAIDYDLQGYLFKQTDEDRVFVEDASFTARNPSWPDELKEGELKDDKSSFEYLCVLAFPLIKNETALATYTREAFNGIQEIVISKGGAIRDKDSGEVKFITEAKYVMFIDKETKELLLCQIFAEMDGENQQYFLSPQRTPEYINDILIRAYKK